MLENTKQIVDAIDICEMQYKTGEITRMQYLKKMGYVAECNKYISDQAKLRKREKMKRLLKSKEN